MRPGTPDGRVPLTSPGPAQRPGCGCDCGNGDRLAFGAPDDEFPLQCHCTCCGPGPANTRRCTVWLHPVVLAVTQLMRGRTIPGASNAEALQHTPVFCEDCREYQLLELRREAVKSARRKRNGEQNKASRELSRSRDDRPMPSTTLTTSSQQPFGFSQCDQEQMDLAKADSYEKALI